MIGKILIRREIAAIYLLRLRPLLRRLIRRKRLSIERRKPGTLRRVGDDHEVIPGDIAASRRLDGDVETLVITSGSTGRVRSRRCRTERVVVSKWSTVARSIGVSPLGSRQTIAEQPFNRHFSPLNAYSRRLFLIILSERVLSGSFSGIITSAWGPFGVYQERFQPDIGQAGRTRAV